MKLAVTRGQAEGTDVLLVEDASTRQEVGRYDQRAGRLSVRDGSRGREVVEALWRFLGTAEPDARHAVDADRPPPDEPAALDRTPEPIVAAVAQPAQPAQSVQRMPSVQSVQSVQSVPSVQRMHSAQPVQSAPRPAVLSTVLPPPRPAAEPGPAARDAREARHAPAVPALRAKGGGRVVDRRLGRLRRDGWAVLSSISRSSSADIDHLVVGPPGVFAIITKHHPGALVHVVDLEVEIDDAPWPYLHHGRFEADAVARALSHAYGTPVKVTPALAVVGTGRIDARECRGDVLVVRGEELDDTLRELPAVYSIQERGRIVAAARRAELRLG